MLKRLLLSILTLTSLKAEGIDPDELNAIYTEAIWFIVIFGTMAVISFIYSNRHAKQYTQKQAATLAKEKALTSERTKQKENRLEELSKLVKNGLLKEEEFKILRKNIQ